MKVTNLKQAIDIVLDLNKLGFFEFESNLTSAQFEALEIPYNAVVEFCEDNYSTDYAKMIRESVQKINPDYFFNY